MLILHLQVHDKTYVLNVIKSFNFLHKKTLVEIKNNAKLCQFLTVVFDNSVLYVLQNILHFIIFIAGQVRLLKFYRQKNAVETLECSDKLSLIKEK